MGCSYSGGDLEANMKSARGVTPKVTWYYFEGAGRGDPLMQMFEYHKQPHEKISISFEDWEAKKKAGGGGEFGGGLPQVDLNSEGRRVNMGQMCAILRSFGARYKYYDPCDWKQASLVDPICEVYGDLLVGVAKVFFAPEDQQVELSTNLQTGVA